MEYQGRQHWVVELDWGALEEDFWELNEGLVKCLGADVASWLLFLSETELLDERPFYLECWLVGWRIDRDDRI